MTTEVGTNTTGYWYDDDARLRAVDVLNALRRWRTAENAAQRRARDSLGIGENAMTALRMLIEADKAGRTVNAKELATRLGITAASTSALVDRLVRTGHIVRIPDPTDRRGVLLSATGTAMHHAIEVLADLDHTAAEVAEKMPQDDMATVVDFLDDMAASADTTDPAQDGLPRI